MENIEYRNELHVAAEKLIHSYGFVTIVSIILSWIASIAAILLIILDQTKWKCSTNISTSLLASYLFSALPQVIFQFLRIGFGRWMTFLLVILELLLPHHLAESLKISGATILLIVVTPNDLVEILRVGETYPNALYCFTTILWLYNQHTKACGEQRNSLIQKDKITYTICLSLMSFYPLWLAFSSFALLVIRCIKDILYEIYKK